MIKNTRVRELVRLWDQFHVNTMVHQRKAPQNLKDFKQKNDLKNLKDSELKNKSEQENLFEKKNDSKQENVFEKKNESEQENDSKNHKDFGQENLFEKKNESEQENDSKNHKDFGQKNDTEQEKLFEKNNTSKNHKNNDSFSSALEIGEHQFLNAKSLKEISYHEKTVNFLKSSLPLEMIFHLVSKYDTFSLKAHLMTSTLKISLQFDILDKYISRINDLQLLEILTVVITILECLEKNIMKENNIINIIKNKQDQNIRLELFSLVELSHEKTTENLMKNRLSDRLTKISLTLCPLIKRRLLLFLLHHGHLDKFIIENFFQFEGTALQAVQSGFT
ncbi:hypothetical protein M153_8940002224 [Pseudoloma neurophilia]|uniref:Uncharacterized protein n=1 Tax=Pseudoloma neurophilia TaxID=146866 RepID=A0A0R0M1C3_9MICR|nr:hypothetical protein M153_8940002224 [Pseudoloma neurophilia]